MAYSNAIPQPTDQLKVSQNDILQNFQAIQTWVEVDHETFGSANEGKHKFVHLPNQSSNPSTAANEYAIFNATYTTSSASEIFVRDPSDGNFIPISAGTTPSADFSAGTQGYAFLGSGLLVKSGVLSQATIAATTRRTANIDLTIGGPNFTFIRTALLQLAYDGDAPFLNVITWVDYTNSTATSLQINIINNGSSATGAFRVLYRVEGATDLSSI